MEIREYWVTSLEADTVYWNVLCQAFEWVWIQPKKKGRVLSVACGRLEEGKVLSEFFDTTDIYGVDIKDADVVRAKDKNPHISDSNIKTWDARELQKIFNEKFDCIILRHPNPSEDLKAWEKILKSSLDRLKKDGLLLLTTFSLHELQIILRMALLKSAKIPFIKENKYPHPLMKMFDAYICVMQRGGIIVNFKERIEALIWSDNLPDATSMDSTIRSLKRSIK